MQRWARSVPAPAVNAHCDCACPSTWPHPRGDIGPLPSPPGCSAQPSRACTEDAAQQKLLWSGRPVEAGRGRRRMCVEGGEHSRERGEFGRRTWYPRGPRRLPRFKPVLRETSGPEARGPTWMTSALTDKGSSSLYCHSRVGRLSLREG